MSDIYDTLISNNMNVGRSVWNVALIYVISKQEHLIENEVSILRQVKHPNIIMLIEEMDTTTELYLVMELVKVRGLFQFH